MTLDKTMLEQLTAGCKTPQDVERLFSQMLQHMINRLLEARCRRIWAMSHGRSNRNARNGKSRKTVQSRVGHLATETPRDHESIHHWKPALQSFQIMFGEERMPLAAL